MEKKVLLVTGASSEIGVKLVEKIYKEYSCVCLQYRTMTEALNKLIVKMRENISVVPIQADFYDEKEIEKLIMKIKEREIIPNNIVHCPAPKAYNKQFHKDQWQNYENGWMISVRSIVQILQAFLPYMIRQKYGRIVFMLTNYTCYKPPKFQASYVTVKYALLGLMKSLSVEYMDKGITVNGISPDMVETKFLSELPELIVEKNREQSPMGRNVYIEEIIPIIEYMLSDLGAAMTGQNIGISGGL